MKELADSIRLHATSRRRFLQMASASGLALVAGAGNTGAAYAQAAKLPLVYDIGGPVAAFWPLWVASNLGYFDPGNLDVSYVLQPTQGVTMLLSGDVQAFGTSIDLVATAIDKGADIVGICETLHSPSSFVVGKGIKSYADLRGKRLGVTLVNSADAVLLSLALAANGVNKGEYEFVPAGTSAQKLAAISSGAIAGMQLTQPQDFQVVQANPDMSILPDTSGILGAQRYCTWVNKTWAAKNADGVVAFLKGQLQACDWLVDPANKDKALAILIERTKTTPEAAQSTYQMYMDKGLFAAKVLIDTKALSQFLDAAQSSGQGTFRPPAEYFDMSYIEKAKAA